MSQLTQRGRYRASGQVSWGKFLVYYVLALVVAATLAGVMFWSFIHGWYIIFLTPVFAALIVGGMLTFAVRAGQCRSPLLAGLLGIAAGGLLYLGYYYVGFLQIAGVENAWRVDAFPSYLSFRMHTDVQHDVGRSASGARERTPDPVMNWIMFTLECGIVVWLTAILTRRRAFVPFCERCGAWKQQDVAIFPPGNGNTIRQWLERGELSRLVGVPTFAPTGRQKKFTSVAVESCATWQAANPCPVYLAVKDVSMGGTMTAFQKFDGSPGKMRVARIELTAAEAIALKPMFPRLAAAMSAGAPAVASPNATGAAGPVLPAALGGGALVDVQSVPEAEARRVMNGGTILIGNLLSLTSLVAFLGAIGGIGGGLYLSDVFNVIDHKAHPDPTRLILGLSLAALSLVLLVLSGYVALRNSSAPANSFYLRRAKHYFGMRVAPIVDMNRPSDQPTFFVEVVPRHNWGKIMLETATDIGFLEVDARRREVRFEGDRERYRIPAAAITECSVQQVSAGMGDSQVVYYMVVIKGATRTGQWEAPFCPRQTSWALPKNHRQASANRIYSSICTIAPWVMPGVAQRIAAGAAMPVDDASGVVTPPAPLPVPLAPAKDGFFRRYGLRLTIIVVAVGLGFWRAHVRNRESNNGGAGAIELGAAGGPSLPLQLSNIRTGQTLTQESPFFAPGGKWTVFDCAPIDDELAGITIAVQSSSPPVDARIPISFSMAAILPTGREQGGRFVADLAKALHRAAPPAREPQLPLTRLTFPTAVLGEHLSPPGQGFKSAAGTWVATKWFIPSATEEDAEIFFNFDLTTGSAQLSEKDPDYDAQVVSVLAGALRDGRPVKSPETMPAESLPVVHP